jgi:hypothetical protein
VEGFHLKVEDFQLEVEASDSDTKGGETTLTLGYQERDKEESGTTVKTLWDMLAEEVQNLLKNFREAIRNTDSRTWELV